MILRNVGDRLQAILQDDHAALAAFMLEHWSDHKFGDDPEREKIIRATRDHDNGWRADDALPSRDPQTGLPIPFNRIDPDKATTIWRRGTDRYLEDDPWHALMITHHAYSVYELSHKRDPAWKEFFTEFARQRAALRSRLGLSHPDVERAYSYLRMADWFSLRFCMEPTFGMVKPDTYGGYSFRNTGEEYQFRPYPFDAQGRTFHLPAYELDPAGYRSDKELRQAFIDPIAIDVHLAPLPRTRR